MSAEDQPALAITCCVDMPAMAVAVEDAPLVECAENTPVSTQLVLRICLIHLAIGLAYVMLDMTETIAGSLL